MLGLSDTELSVDDTTLYHRAYKAMINMLIPSISSATRDLREIIRLCRLLWPVALQILNDNDSTSSLSWKVSKKYIGFVIRHPAEHKYNNNLFHYFSFQCFRNPSMST